MRLIISFSVLLAVQASALAASSEASRLEAACHAYFGAPQFGEFFHQHHVSLRDECRCVTAKALGFETANDRSALRQSYIPDSFKENFRAATMQCFQMLGH